MPKISLFLIEDNSRRRNSWQTLLSEYPEILWQGEAANVQQGLAQILASPPNVLLLDLDLSPQDGIQCTKKLKSLHLDTHILILTLNSEPRTVLEAFRAGADSYCMKNISPCLLLEAIKATHLGQSWIDPAIAKVVLEHHQIAPVETKVDYALTERELEVLQLIVNGLSNAEIAQNLYISIGTVKTHVRNILNKLCADDRTQAAVRALRFGLVK